MHENDISKYRNENFPQNISMHGMLVHEILGGKFFISMHGNIISMHENIIFMHENIIFMHESIIFMHENIISLHDNIITIHDISMPRYFHA